MPQNLPFTIKINLQAKRCKTSTPQLCKKASNAPLTPKILETHAPRVSDVETMITEEIASVPDEYYEDSCPTMGT